MENFTMEGELISALVKKFIETNIFKFKNLEYWFKTYLNFDCELAIDDKHSDFINLDIKYTDTHSISHVMRVTIIKELKLGSIKEG